jgi:hypothetical protein
MIEGLTFDAQSHTYYAQYRVVPGVTSVLAPLNDFKGVPPFVLERARQFGVHVHAAVDMYNQHILDEPALDEVLRPRLSAYKRFLSETGFVVTGSECIVSHKPLFYAGTCDLTGTMRGSTWVVDIKSGLMPISVGPQLAAYQEALPERPRRRLCVALGDHEYKMRECTDRRDFAIFQNCLNIWNFKHEHQRGNGTVDPTSLGQNGDGDGTDPGCGERLPGI